MGFEPTRGGPIGLAGWHLSRSAKVSSAKSASQLRCSPGSHVTVSLCFLCPPHLAISPALTDSWEQCASAGNRTRVRWQRRILPLGHWCLWKIFGLDSYRLQIPCTPFSSSLHDATFSRQSTPHFVALFQPPVRNPQETLGNPHSCSGNLEVTPSKCLHTPFAPLQGFHPASRVSFLGADASTSAQYWTEVTHNPWAHFPGKTAWRVRWRRHATWNSRSVGYLHHSLQVDTCGIRTRAGRPHRLCLLQIFCKSAGFQSRQSCDCQSLLLVPPSPRHLTRSHRLMRTMCISRESNPGQMATMYSTTRPLMPLENLWTWFI